MTAPTLTLAVTSSVSYSVAPAGPYATGQSVTVTATLQEGYVFPATLPDGWTRASTTTAARSITFDSVECVVVNPETPTVVQALCMGGALQVPTLTLASTNGIAYDVAPAAPYTGGRR